MKRFFLFLLIFVIASEAKQSPAQGFWTQKSNFGGLARDCGIGFSIGTKGYIGTGYNCNGLYFNDFWEWDQVTDTWTQKANYPGQGVVSPIGFSIGNKGYVGTGSTIAFNTPQRDFWEYDPVTNTWTQKANFGGHSRVQAVGFSIGNKGYIGTGIDSTYNCLQDLWEYDVTLNAWTQKSNFQGGIREAAVGFSIGTKGYIGTGGNFTIDFNDFWEWDQATDVWTQKANFGGIHREGAIGLSIGKFGYIGIGDTTASSTLTLPDFWQYNSYTNTWTQMSNYGGGPQEYAATFVIGCKGYVGTGGRVISSSSYIDTNSFWEFTPPPITASFSSAQNITCFGSNNGSATVNVPDGTPAFNYVWNSSPVQTTQTATGLSPGTFSVTVVDSLGCYCSDSVKITSRPPMVFSFSSVTNVDCFGNNNGGASVSVSGATPSYTYLWNSIPIQTTQTASSLYAGTYSISVIDSLGCSFADTVTITSPTGLTVQSPVISNVKCFGTNTGSATVNATGGTPNYFYSWNPTLQTSTTAIGLTATIYTLTVTDNNGCIINTLVPITQPPLLTESVSNDTSICAGTNANANVFAQGGTPGYNYQWMPSGATSTGINISPTSTTTYIAQVTDSNGCTDTASVKVNVIPMPFIAFSSTLDTCSHCLQMKDNSINANAWLWNFGDSTSASTSSLQNPNHCYKDTGVYFITLTVNSSPQCKSTNSFSVPIPDYTLAPIVPNVFTPNGDGVNDEFKISGLDKCSAYSIKIYNRWGVAIFETQKTDFAWDGNTTAGTQAEDGTYFYVLKNSTATKTGFVTLLR